MMAAMFGILASKGKKNAPMRVEGHNTHPVFKGSFSGHRFVRTYPDMNKQNTDRKIRHRKMVEDYLSCGVCWTPFGLFRMNH